MLLKGLEMRDNMEFIDWQIAVVEEAIEVPSHVFEWCSNSVGIKEQREYLPNYGLYFVDSPEMRRLDSWNGVHGWLGWLTMITRHRTDQKQILLTAREAWALYIAASIDSLDLIVNENYMSESDWYISQMEKESER